MTSPSNSAEQDGSAASWSDLVLPRMSQRRYFGCCVSLPPWELLPVHKDPCC